MPVAGLLLICDFNAHGGTQTQVLELLAALDRGRYRPVLATLNLDTGLARRVAALDVPVRDLGLRGSLHPRTWGEIRRLGTYMREESIQIAHGFLLQGNIVTAAASRRARVPYVTSVRNLELWKRPHELWASRWAHAGAAAVTFNSRHVRDLVSRRESIPRSKTRVIPNGLAAEPRGATNDGMAGLWPAGSEHRLLCAASFFPKKGHRFLLEAFSILKRSMPGAALILAGTGPAESEIRERAGRDGFGGSVIFAGHRPDARALIATADVLLLSSIEEGMPNVLLEAMAAGVPQVATSVGGTPEAVVEGVTGFLVPPRDPHLMAERLQKLLSDKSLRRRMSDASRDRAARLFTSARMARDHEALYDQVLGRSA